MLFMPVLNQFKKTLEENGCDILLLSKNIKSSRKSFLNHCRSRKVDGALIFGDFASEQVKGILASEIPAIGFDYMGDEIIGVTSDNYDKMNELTDHLISLGHKKIVFIKGEDNWITNEREQGFRDAAQAAGISEHTKVIGSHYYSQEHIYNLTNKLLDSSDVPTAIMFPDDYSAFGGIRAIKERGLDIPKDISITAYDGLEILRDIFPFMTTVKQDVITIGKMLADKLMEVLSSPKDYQKKIYKVPSQIIYGSSCAKIDAFVK